MTALPEWIERIKSVLQDIESKAPYRQDAEKMVEALAIAWEALEYYGKMKGHNGEKVWTLVVPSQEAKDAMRRIAELGKE